MKNTVDLNTSYESLHNYSATVVDDPDVFSLQNVATQRRFVAIDEAIDLATTATVNAGNLGILQAVLSLHPDICAAFPRQTEVIRLVAKAMNTIVRQLIPPADRPDGAPSEVLITRDALIKDTSLSDFTELRKALKEVRFDRIIGRRSSAKKNERYVEDYDAVLRDLQLVLSQWTVFLHKWNGGPSLTSARLLMPEGVTHGIIMDATARKDVLYQLLPNVIVARNLPNPRLYDNATWHVATDFKTGAGSLSGRAKEDAPRIIAALEKELDPERKVLVVGHTDVEEHFARYIRDPASPRVGLSKFAGFDFEHWHNINGKNQWRDYDVILTYGLPHRDPSWPKNFFQATQGPQSNEWLNAPQGERPWNEHPDICLALADGKIVADLIQAVNRIACRKMVDAKGNHPKVDIYSLLPSSEENDDVEVSPARLITRAVRDEMPTSDGQGIKVVKWKLPVGLGSKLTPVGKKPNYYEVFIRSCKRLKRGKHVALNIRDALGIPPETWEHMARVIKKQPKHRLTVGVTEAGVRYHVERVERSFVSFLIKD